MGARKHGRLRPRGPSGVSHLTAVMSRTKPSYLRFVRLCCVWLHGNMANLGREGGTARRPRVCRTTRRPADICSCHVCLYTRECAVSGAALPLHELFSHGCKPYCSLCPLQAPAAAQAGEPAERDWRRPLGRHWRRLSTDEKTSGLKYRGLRLSDQLLGCPAAAFVLKPGSSVQRRTAHSGTLHVTARHLQIYLNNSTVSMLYSMLIILRHGTFFAIAEPVDPAIKGSTCPTRAGYHS